MKMSDLQAKKIISVISGKNIGSIIDCNLTEDGKITDLTVDSGGGLFSFNRESNIKISWGDIAKIGEDVILVRK